MCCKLGIHWNDSSIAPFTLSRRLITRRPIMSFVSTEKSRENKKSRKIKKWFYISHYENQQRRSKVIQIPLLIKSISSLYLVFNFQMRVNFASVLICLIVIATFLENASAKPGSGHSGKPGKRNIVHKVCFLARL